MKQNLQRKNIDKLNTKEDTKFEQMNELMNEIYGKLFISSLLALNRCRAGNYLRKGTKNGKARFEFERRGLLQKCHCYNVTTG